MEDVHCYSTEAMISYLKELYVPEVSGLDRTMPLEVSPNNKVSFNEGRVPPGCPNTSAITLENSTRKKSAVMGDSAIYLISAEPSSPQKSTKIDQSFLSPSGNKMDLKDSDIFLSRDRFDGPSTASSQYQQALTAIGASAGVELLTQEGNVSTSSLMLFTSRLRKASTTTQEAADAETTVDVEVVRRHLEERIQRTLDLLTALAADEDAQRSPLPMLQESKAKGIDFKSLKDIHRLLKDLVSQS